MPRPDANPLPDRRRATPTVAVMPRPQPPVTSLLTDQYELTMVEAALRSGAAQRRSVFEVTARRLPAGRRYGVMAGIDRLLAAIGRFRFDEEELDHLGAAGIVNAETLTFLAGYRFSGHIWGCQDGEVYSPDTPLLVVEGSFAEAVVLETLVLSVLNHDCAIAAAASRMVSAAGGRPLIEMGSRRTHEMAAVDGALAAYICGFDGTSNLEAGRRYGVPTLGTSAHSFTLAHDTEREAFAAQVAALGSGTTLLVDTYDVADAVATAVEVAGPGLGAVRLDSGDLLALAFDVRAQLDELGNVDTRIVVTGDLDEYAIAALAAAPVDSYGVGTSLVTGSGAPTAGLVYKLVARAVDGDPGAPVEAVAKRAPGKPSRGGRKTVWRRLAGSGRGVADVVRVLDAAEPSDAIAAGGPGRPLLVPLMREGQPVWTPGTAESRKHHEEAMAQLPAHARQLSPGDPALPTLIT